MKPWLPAACTAFVATLSVWAPTPAASETFRYDALGRLTQVTSQSGAVRQYVYDAADNLRQVTVGGALAGALRQGVGPGSQTERSLFAGGEPAAAPVGPEQLARGNDIARSELGPRRSPLTGPHRPPLRGLTF